MMDNKTATKVAELVAITSELQRRDSEQRLRIKQAAVKLVEDFCSRGLLSQTKKEAAIQSLLNPQDPHTLLKSAFNRIAELEKNLAQTKAAAALEVGTPVSSASASSAGSVRYLGAATNGESKADQVFLAGSRR